MGSIAKILVVDDEKNICESVSKILTKKGFTVDCSYDAEAAVKKIEEVPYNLVLLDIMMPKISGMDLLKTIRTQYRECNVVMITGYPSIDTAVEATQVGAMDYLPKPFTPDELIKVVNNALSQDLREGFCEKGRMVCKKYTKTGVCKDACALKKAKLKIVEKKEAAKEQVRMDADMPFDYDEVAMATSDMYAKTMSSSDIPIVGWQRYYEQNNNILVVDDEIVICNSVRKILAGAGFNVEYANTTEEAVKKLENKKYALVLVDLRLPTVGGVELLRQIKESWPGLKTVVITGYASIDTAVETTRLGALSYLSKPFTPDELNSTVKEAIQKVA
jgi:DNA-binding NtrC family response regulator